MTEEQHDSLDLNYGKTADSFCIALSITCIHILDEYHENYIS